jgi:hypothetical protein
MLDFFVHPALFWLFGRNSALAIVKHSGEQIVLEDLPMA